MSRRVTITSKTSPTQHHSQTHTTSHHPSPSSISLKTLTTSYPSSSLSSIHLSLSLKVIIHYGNDQPTQPKEWPANTILRHRPSRPNSSFPCASNVGVRLSLQSSLPGCASSTVAGICCGSGTNGRAETCAAGGAGCKCSVRQLFWKLRVSSDDLASKQSSLRNHMRTWTLTSRRNGGAFTLVG